MHNTPTSLIKVKDLPEDYDLAQLENPEELLKFERITTTRVFAADSENDDYYDEEMMLDDGYLPEEIVKKKETTLSGLLSQEIHGIKLNDIAGIPQLFNQLFDRLLLYLKVEEERPEHCRISSISTIRILGEATYQETDKELQQRIRRCVAAKKKASIEREKKKTAALAQLKAAGFVLDGTALKKSKKNKK